jgi:acyl-CoA synthetase (AMP-forming)/AMP-acid ligase II
MTVSDSNIVEILQQRALSQGGDTVYIFLQDGENKEVRLTYQELDRQAKAIAFQLQQLVAPSSRALLVYSFRRQLVAHPISRMTYYAIALPKNKQHDWT